MTVGQTKLDEVHAGHSKLFISANHSQLQSKSLVSQTVETLMLSLWGSGVWDCVSYDSAEPCNCGHIKMKEWNSLQNKGITAYKAIRDENGGVFMFTGGATFCLERTELCSQQLLKYMKYML